MEIRRELEPHEARAFDLDRQDIKEQEGVIEAAKQKILRARSRMSRYAMLICEEGEQIDFTRNAIVAAPEPADTGDAEN